MYALTETWLSGDISDGELGFNNYTIHRCDRSHKNSNKSKGGGVLLAVSSKIPSNAIPNIDESIEHIFVNLNLGLRKILLVCAYIPPHASWDVYERHFSQIEEICMINNISDLIVLGDYNISQIDWDENGLSRKINCCPRIYNLVSEFKNYLNLSQLNTTRNANGNIIDLIFSNIGAHSLYRHMSQDCLVPIDPHHPVITIDFTLTLHQPYNRQNVHLRNFKTTNFSIFNDRISSIDWNDLFRENTVDDCVKLLYDVLDEVVEDCVPKITVSNCSYPKWFTPELKLLNSKKKLVHREYKTLGLSIIYDEFSRLRAECKKLNRKCYINYIKSLEASIYTDPRNFWSYTKGLKSLPRIPESVRFLNRFSLSERTSVNFFADFFSSVYVKHNLSYANNSPMNTLHLSSMELSLSKIIEKMKKLKPTYNLGPDGIPSILLKKVEALAIPFHLIFNKSLTSGIFPKKWKLSYIKPLLKSGSSVEVVNYRPICHLSAIAKLFESIVYDIISPLCNDFIITEQHGFRPNKSTTSNLLLFEELVLSSFARKKQVDVIYTDISKAFDTVDIDWLVSKLKVFGFDGMMLRWLDSYLHDRQLQVKINNSLSYAYEARSGVPQGSHLGPLLFLIFINDISYTFNNVKFLLFADDLKLFHEVENSQDAVILQNNFLGLINWCDKNGLKINFNKCFSMSYYRGKERVNYDYMSDDNNKLKKISTFRDLGVTFNSSLGFEEHITEITNSALKLLGFITRNTKHFRNIFALKNLFCSIVRSRLEYASPIWSPYYKTYIQRLERVQRKFLRYIAFKLQVPIAEISYDDLYIKLHILPLEIR